MTPEASPSQHLTLLWIRRSGKTFNAFANTFLAEHQTLAEKGLGRSDSR